MGVESIELPNTLDTTIKTLFEIDAIPVVNPDLLRGSKLSKEGALQLFLYAPFIDWKYHADRDHETGDRKIDDILGFLYVYFTNPAGIPNEEDLSFPLLELYYHIRTRLANTRESTELLRDSRKRATDIL